MWKLLASVAIVGLLVACDDDENEIVCDEVQNGVCITYETYVDNNVPVYNDPRYIPVPSRRAVSTPMGPTVRVVTRAIVNQRAQQNRSTVTVIQRPAQPTSRPVSQPTRSAPPPTRSSSQSTPGRR